MAVNGRSSVGGSTFRQMENGSAAGGNLFKREGTRLKKTMEEIEQHLLRWLLLWEKLTAAGEENPGEKSR